MVMVATSLYLSMRHYSCTVCTVRHSLRIRDKVVLSHHDQLPDTTVKADHDFDGEQYYDPLSMPMKA